jgi:hypothetical protein
MLKILRAKAGRSFKQGPFRIRRIRPGAILGHDARSCLWSAERR